MKLQDFDFRIWDSENKALIYNTGSVVGLNPDVHEIELWTGLRDIYGEKIFEGDYIEDTKFGLSYFYRYKVFYNVDTASFYLEAAKTTNECYSLISKYPLSIYSIDGEKFRVVGNIHETKEFYMIYKE